MKIAKLVRITSITMVYDTYARCSMVLEYLSTRLCHHGASGIEIPMFDAKRPWTPRNICSMVIKNIVEHHRTTVLNTLFNLLCGLLWWEHHLYAMVLSEVHEHCWFRSRISWSKCSTLFHTPKMFPHGFRPQNPPIINFGGCFWGYHPHRDDPLSKTYVLKTCLA